MFYPCQKDFCSIELLVDIRPDFTPKVKSRTGKIVLGIDDTVNDKATYVVLSMMR